MNDQNSQKLLLSTSSLMTAVYCLCTLKITGEPTPPNYTFRLLDARTESRPEVQVVKRPALSVDWAPGGPGSEGRFLPARSSHRAKSRAAEVSAPDAKGA